MSLLAGERSPLLGPSRNPGLGSRRRSCGSRFFGIFKKETEPSWMHSLRFLFSTTWANAFLVFLPLSFISHFAHWDAAICFTFSFLSLIPLATVCYAITNLFVDVIKPFPTIPVTWNCHRTIIPGNRGYAVWPPERVVW